MKLTRKIFALALCLMMVFSMAATAFAAGDYTITIKNNNKESAKGHVYYAYQIFDGILDSTGTILTEIGWGQNITDGAAFLADLKTESDLFVGGANIFAAATDAEEVAEILALPANHTTTIISAFAKVATAHVSEPPVAKSGTMIEDGTKGVYTITIPADKGGYYLVKDDPTVLAGKENKDVSDYILQVVGNVTVEHKGSIPTLDKQVSETGETYHDSISTAVNQKHTYRIIAELPDDYNLYDNYYLEFSDKMSKELSFDNIERVYVVIRSSNTRLDIDPSCYNVSTATLPATDEKAPEGTHLRLVINDTKTITSGGTPITLTPEDAVVIIYKAHVNESAVIDNTGIPNTATIIYSNDPNTSGHGQSNPDETNVYPINLNLLKVDGKATSTKLEGAQFILSRIYNEGGSMHPEYAVIKNGKLDTWSHHHAADGCAADNAEHLAAQMGTVLTTGTDGQINVAGLDEGTYQLIELVAPDGYNKLVESVNISVSITINEEADVIATMNGSTNQGNITFNAASATVQIEIPNFKGDVLPSTGGIGTTLFYVFGSIMVLAAVVLLVTKKRMNYEA